ncbi:MAG: 5-formyltetrahydrofolate cyclo-ligase [Hyphomicrobiales bacterium]
MQEDQSLKAAKQDLRTRALVARDQLRAPYRASCAKKLLDYQDVFGDVNGKVVSGFLPIRSEIDAQPLMNALRAKGAELCLPAVTDKTTIEFRAYEDEQALVEAGFGTLAPPAHARVLHPEMMIVPLSVFDTYGGRIGYGAGYYDRAIARLVAAGRPPLTVGLAFALQEVPLVPQDAHDIRLDYILTHEGVIAPEVYPALSIQGD